MLFARSMRQDICFSLFWFHFLHFCAHMLGGTGSFNFTIWEGDPFSYIYPLKHGIWHNNHVFSQASGSGRHSCLSLPAFSTMPPACKCACMPCLPACLCLLCLENVHFHSHICLPLSHYYLPVPAPTHPASHLCGICTSLGRHQRLLPLYSPAGMTCMPAVCSGMLPNHGSVWHICQSQVNSI